MSDSQVFDPERLITTLARHGVQYVLIGALAARLQGFPRLTADADITPSRDPSNLERLGVCRTWMNLLRKTGERPEYPRLLVT